MKLDKDTAQLLYITTLSMLPSEPRVNNVQSAKNPKTRQRAHKAHKAPPVFDVPDINDDANERSRILNVLAQRRHREYIKNIMMCLSNGTLNRIASQEKDWCPSIACAVR